MLAAAHAPIVFRADANAQIGVGHVMRCLAVAEALKARGAVCRFASRALPTNVARRLADAGIERTHLPEDVPPLVDAAATLAATEPGSWVVVDGYGFDAAYQRALKSCGNPLLAFHDGQTMDAFPADIVVNPNMEADAAAYRSTNAFLALGLRYLPLRKPFWQGRTPLRNGKPRILVTLGGADPDNLTGAMAHALAPLGDRAEVMVLVGPANPHRASLEAGLPSGVTLLFDVDDMAALLSSATIVIAAAGVTLWEAMASGACVLGVYRDPLQSAALLAAEGADLLAGRFDAAALNLSMLREAAALLLDDETARSGLVGRSVAAVDGQGAHRCADLILGTAQRRAA
jgi:UDP-2,4-diacetamido-2,4,6-trideoxy-beta-L-altropyranose hydrolase